MYKILSVFSMAMISIIPVVAQKSGGGTSSGSTSPSPQTGFNYVLQYNHHLQYTANHIDSYYFTYEQLANLQKTDLFDQKYDNKTLVTVNLYLDRRAVLRPSPDPINLADYDLRKLDKNSDITSTVIDPAKVTKYGNKDTVLLIRVQYRDTLPRYWELPPGSSLLKRRRLRMAISQDSATLRPRLLGTHFRDHGDGPGERESHLVTNSLYRGSMSTSELILNFDGDRPTPFPKRDSILQGTINGYTQVGPNADFDHHWRAFEEIEVNFEFLKVAFESDIKKLYAISDSVGIRARYYSDFKLVVSQEFAVFSARYRMVDSLYDGLTRTFRQGTLNTIYRDLSNPTIRSDYHQQMDYIVALLQLGDKYIRRIAPLSTNTFDQMVAEEAIPIETKDSANNYTVNIIRKSLSGQPVFFYRFNFSAWDYGTLTVPYRYRPTPKNRPIFATAGKDSAIAPQSTSEGNISLAIYLGRKWGRTRFYSDPTQTHNTISFETAILTGPTLVPVGLSSVDTTSRYVGAKTNYNYTGPSNFFAWTFGLGAVVEWKPVNFGAFVGADFPLVKSSGWIYARKLWFGFGIGVNLGMFATGRAGN